MEVFGGHLRPDAELAAFGSAPVRVHRNASGPDPLAGTVRALHLGVPRDHEGLLTALSPLVLSPRMGFGDFADEAWPIFGRLPSEAVALALSEDVGAIAHLTLCEGPELMGAYSVFASGRRLWSAAFVPGLLYVTWDGAELRVEPMDASDPTPVEGGHSDFAAHGLQLLFGEPLQLTHQERMGLMPSLVGACRPPTVDARAATLVREGRFLPANVEATDEELERLVGSFVEPAEATLGAAGVLMGQPLGDA